MRTCKHCGCTDDRACVRLVGDCDPEIETCSWVSDDECSACVPDLLDAAGGEWTHPPAPDQVHLHHFPIRIGYIGGLGYIQGYEDCACGRRYIDDLIERLSIPPAAQLQWAVRHMQQRFAAQAREGLKAWDAYVERTRGR